MTRVLALLLLTVSLGACFSKPDRIEAGIDGTPPDDALPGACSMVSCAAAGGTCTAESVCLIVETMASDRITCPPGAKCRVECTGDVCNGGVSCGAATECEVVCSGNAACQDQGVDCGTAARCDVRCLGARACEKGQGSARSVECRSSACTVTCDGASACDQGINTSGGSCATHCCNGACAGGVVATCTRDAVCT